MKNAMLLTLTITTLAACSPNTPLDPLNPLDTWNLPSHSSTPANTTLTFALPPRSAGPRTLTINPQIGSLDEHQNSFDYTPPQVTTGRWVNLSATVGNKTQTSLLYIIPKSFSSRTARINSINTIRATPRNCGNTPQSAAPALTWSDALEEAAWNYASRMALENFMSHIDPQGGTPEVRASRAGYTGRTVGENLGRTTEGLPEVTQAWLNSPEHCLNLMDPSYTEVASVAVDFPSGGQAVVMMFGAP